MRLSRRAFLWSSGVATLGFVGLRTLLEDPHADLRAPGYGPLVRDPAGVVNLPAGFSYQMLSRTGEKMDDGFLVPGAHDGMAAFPGPGGRTILVRNHELEPALSRLGPFGPGNELLSRLDPALLYDAGRGRTPGLGGTTTLVYHNEDRKLERHFLSLAGTWRNCAGGPTPWGSWLSCEETVLSARLTVEKDHGFVFEVSASAEPGLAAPVPLRAMGRFCHEAAAVDARSGCVYLTEDRGGQRFQPPEERGLGLFYRFVPQVPGELARGGRLQALKLRHDYGADTTNWKRNRIPVGRAHAADWVALENVDGTDDLRYRGRDRGAAGFTRGEGIWVGSDGIYFCCTDGGRSQKGQVWRYRPSPEEGRDGERGDPGRLELFIEPNAGSLLENCDNITVAPWGDLILCEDKLGRNRIVGVTPQGKLYTIAENLLRAEGLTPYSEFAGATFAPDGSALFVNLQRPGITLAIFSPRERWFAP